MREAVSPNKNVISQYRNAYMEADLVTEGIKLLPMMLTSHMDAGSNPDCSIPNPLPC